MEIEVRQPNGFNVKAEVKKITPDALFVAYKELAKPDENVAYENCRMMKKNTGNNAPKFKNGDMVEAYIKQGELIGWQKAKIRDIKGVFAVVEIMSEPPSVEIIALDACRDGGLTTPLSFDKMKQFSIPVPDDMRSYFERSDSCKDLYDTIENIHIEYDNVNGNIIFWSFSDAIIRKVKIVADFFMNDSRQRMQFMQRKEQVKKLDKSDDPKEARYVEEFQVVADLMGLAIGSQGTNFARARHIEGIREIVYNQCKNDEDLVTIKIFAEDADAAEQARSILEYVLHGVEVPKRMMSRIIGKNGTTIQEIVDKSGVVRVQIEDEEEDGEIIKFIFTGTKETVSHAELLIQFHLKHLKEMQAMREELNRKTPSLAHPPPKYVPPQLMNLLDGLKAAGSAINGRGGASTSNFMEYNKARGGFHARGRERRSGQQRYGGNREPLAANSYESD